VSRAGQQFDELDAILKTEQDPVAGSEAVARKPLERHAMRSANSR
jgi:hypothetical protein